jgi:hypothetical protein
MIEGTPITLGGNDVHGDCVTVAPWNAAYITAMRAGIKLPLNETGPFELYKTLGGMPQDIGLDPGVMFTYWYKNAINGYRLSSVQSIGISDFASIRQTIEDTGFCIMTAILDTAQLKQYDWATVPNDTQDGGHMFVASGFIATRFTDSTWGETCEFEQSWFANQGVNCWRAELVKA